jgi:hypothetical protein
MLFDPRHPGFQRQKLVAPLGTVFYTISCLHGMTVSLEQDGEGSGTEPVGLERVVRQAIRV